MLVVVVGGGKAAARTVTSSIVWGIWQNVIESLSIWKNPLRGNTAPRSIDERRLSLFMGITLGAAGGVAHLVAAEAGAAAAAVATTATEAMPPPPLPELTWLHLQLQDPYSDFQRSGPQKMFSLFIDHHKQVFVERPAFDETFTED